MYYKDIKSEKIMKKSIVMLVFAFATLSVVSCKDDKKVETTEEHAGHDHAHYVCPMDCEKGKVYETEGNCPVCEMDLVKEDSVPPPPEENEDDNHSEEGHEGHNH
jgi:hypothetical protein